jgi:hypothetical protein
MALHWVCNLCEKSFLVNAITTGNIRNHLSKNHEYLDRALKEKKSHLSSKKRSSGSSSTISQTHLDKKARVITFTEQGFIDR